MRLEQLSFEVLHLFVFRDVFLRFFGRFGYLGHVSDRERRDVLRLLGLVLRCVNRGFIQRAQESISSVAFQLCQQQVQVFRLCYLGNLIFQLGYALKVIFVNITLS